MNKPITHLLRACLLGLLLLSGGTLVMATDNPPDTCTPDTPTACTAVTIVANVNINIRAGSSTDDAILSVLRRNRSATALGITADNWLYIRTSNDLEGWIAGWLVTYNGDRGTLPTLNATQPLAAQVAAGVAGNTTQTNPLDCSTFRIVSPVGTMTNGAQIFAWTLVPGADDYWVTITNTQTNDEFLYNVGGVAAQAEINTSDPRLGAGTAFEWEVNAFFEGKPYCTVQTQITRS